MTDIASLTAADLTRLYRRRELSPVEVTRDVLARIDAANPTVNAFILIDREGAISDAQASEARWRKGEARGPVDGVPATVKDNVWAKGLPSRRGSLTTDDAPTADDAPAVARLLGEEPARQVADDLRRFKQVIETGEIATNEQVLSEAGAP